MLAIAPTEVPEAPLDRRGAWAEIMLVECCCGGGSTVRLTENVLSLMPSRTKVVTVEEATQSLTGITQMNLFKLASRTAQAKASVA